MFLYKATFILPDIFHTTAMWHPILLLSTSISYVSPRLFCYNNTKSWDRNLYLLDRFSSFPLKFNCKAQITHNQFPFARIPWPMISACGHGDEGAPVAFLSPTPNTSVRDVSHHTQLFTRCWDPNSDCHACAALVIPQVTSSACSYGFRLLARFLTMSFGSFLTIGTYYIKEIRMFL